VIVEIAQRFPRRGGRVLGAHGAGSASKVTRSRLTCSIGGAFSQKRELRATCSVRVR
jgi:hypothetical protein